MEADVYISIGSNLDREANIREAVRSLRQYYGKIRLSPVYETQAVGFDGSHFFNQVAMFRSGDGPADIRHRLKLIEDNQGRCRNAPHFSDRTLDLDLLLYAELVSLEERLPRDEILEQAYILCPLADIAGDVPHPTIHRSFRELWIELAQHIQAPARVTFTP